MYWFYFLMAIVIFSLPPDISATASSDSFAYDFHDVDSQLAPLNQLEKLHKAAPEKTFNELISENGLADHNFAQTTNLFMNTLEPMPVVPAFWWGCVLGWIGILIVFLVTQDSDQTKSALWGCIVNGLLGFFIYGIILINELSSGTGCFYLGCLYW